MRDRALETIRGLVLGLAVIAAEPARSECFFLCDPEVRDADAAERLTNWIGPLPAGVEIVGLAEDGFQDVRIQARLSVDHKAFLALLSLLGVRENDLIAQDDLYMGPAAPPWFDWQSHAGVRSSVARSPWLTHLTIAVVREPEVEGQWRVYLWGHAA